MKDDSYSYILLKTLISSLDCNLILGNNKKKYCVQ